MEKNFANNILKRFHKSNLQTIKFISCFLHKQNDQKRKDYVIIKIAK